MAQLFEETRINHLTLQNRLVRSATWEGLCTDDGKPTTALNQYYSGLAQGGVGLIISGYTFVRPEGKQLPWKMGIHTDDFGPAFEDLTSSVHQSGGKITIQLVHAGGQTDSASAGQQPLAPSSIEAAQFPELPAEMSGDEINAVVQAFADGARRAKAWGFDGIQLHGAHGYLINQFLSPLTNHRQDDYGGDIEGRSRFLMDVVRSVRAAVGDDFPVMIKLNASDNLEGGLGEDDAITAARLLDAAGIDAIEVSTGTPASGRQGPARSKINKPEQEGYNLDLARRIKAAVSCPIMVVGGFRSFERADRAVADGDVDYIALARPLIRQPDLPARWARGERDTATCISCNKCFGTGLEGNGIYCAVERKLQEKNNGGGPA
jgi:2,4-dienoyl-CoA reductase-like NADH-dependent reductase (Old Yellow Enzyme family)